MQLKLFVQQSQNEVFDQASAIHIAIHENGQILILFLNALDVRVVLQIDHPEYVLRSFIDSYLILILRSFNSFHEEFEFHTLWSKNGHCCTVLDVALREVSYHLVMAVHFVIQSHKFSSSKYSFYQLPIY